MKGVTATMAAFYISAPQVKSEDTIRQLFFTVPGVSFFVFLEAISVRLGKLDSCSIAGLLLLFMVRRQIWFDTAATDSGI